MSGSIRTPTEAGEPTPSVYAEAAAWVARLHGPNHTKRVENGLQRWLNANAAHAIAFEAMTAAWEVTGKLPKRAFPRTGRWQRMGYRDGFFRAALAVSAITVVAIGAEVFLFMSRGVATAVGEQRAMTLEDGSRVTLNTNTRVTVHFDKRERRLRLESGEAFFEVAMQPARPFVVEAAGRQVTALGTSFVVREDKDRLSVILVEGKVAVSPPSTDVRTSAVAQVAKQDGKPIILAAGQRLSVVAYRDAKLDKPPIDKVTAWRRGLVDFDNTPVADAIEDMNRYSDLKLQMPDAAKSEIKITGVFRSGDTSSFAGAVARAYGLVMVQAQDEIFLKTR